MYVIPVLFVNILPYSLLESKQLLCFGWSDPVPDAEVRDDGSHWENSSVPAEVDEMFSSNSWGSVSSMALSLFQSQIV